MVGPCNTLTMMSDPVFPRADKLNYLAFECGNQDTSCDHLLDYNGVRYHLRMDYNFENKDAVENKYLQKCYDAYENDAADADDYVYDCLDLVWPFVQQVDAVQERTGRSEKDYNPTKKVPTIVKIQVKTINGYLQAMEHHEHLKYPRVEPVENNFPGVTLFPSDEVERVQAIDALIYKVMIRGTAYCLKTVHRGGEQCFIREVDILQKITGHPNIVSLIGITDAGDGRVDGMVLDLIPGSRLSDIATMTTSQRTKWKRQISETVAFLHERGVVWSDAKPENILIEDSTGNAVLIDFGGGTTKGWVDLHLGGTVEGDLQGLHRILEYLDNLSVGA